MSNNDDKLLEGFFASAKAVDAVPSDDLMARVLADADKMQPRQPKIAREMPKAQSPFASLLDIIGGWPALGGVAVAGVTGLWLGVAPPATVEGWTADLLGTTEAISFLGDFDSLTALESTDG